ncbi:MAG: hypothetical protein WCK53_08760, partial [Methanomicrobiales archaeon]
YKYSVYYTNKVCLYRTIPNISDHPAIGADNHDLEDFGLAVSTVNMPGLSWHIDYTNLMKEPHLFCI